MRNLIITNNPKVEAEYSHKFEVDFCPDKTQREILIKARDQIHLGAKLLIHPLMGRIRPHETPYKSVVLEPGKGGLHLESIYIIEESILATERDLRHSAYRKYYGGQTEDLQLMDLLLLKSGIEGR